MGMPKIIIKPIVRFAPEHRHFNDNPAMATRLKMRTVIGTERLLGALVKRGIPSQVVPGSRRTIDAACTHDEATRIAHEIRVGEPWKIDPNGRGPTPILDASQRDLPVCAECGAQRRDLCRDAGGRTRFPHESREGGRP